MTPLRFSRKYVLWCIALMLAWPGVMRAAPADVLKVKERLLEGLVGQNVDEAKAAEWAKSINDKGRWPDLDYTEYPNKVVAYSPMTHQARTRTLALAAAKKVKLSGVDSSRLHAALQAALMDNVGRVHDATFNWQHDWYMTYIGAPGEYGDCLLLAQTVLPADKMKKPIAHLRDVLAMKGRDGGSRWEGGGQNQVWVAGVSLRKAALELDEAMMRRSFESIASTIQFLPPGGGEGFRADAAFHQHGNQIYSGGYGAWYVTDVLRRMQLAEDTVFKTAFNPTQVSALAYVVREGHRWMTYRNVMDFGARGRNISRPGNDFGQPAWVMETLARLDASNAPVYRAWIEHNQGGPFSTPGNRHFWLSDFMVHRGKDWYVSAKVISKRTDGTETMNGENLLGFNLPLGATVIMTSGEEYTRIFPIWDWARIPGTTAELGAEGPSPHTFRGSNPFAGGVSDGTNGVLAFASEYKGIESKKAYFGIGDFMVCLGAGISGDGKDSIVTSINQCFQKGQVRVGESTARAVEGGPEVIRNVKWVSHDDVGYLFFKPATVTVQAKTQSGSWRRTSGDQSDANVSGEVFSLWLDHGKGPRSTNYAYLIAPRVDAGQCARLVDEHGFEVLRNDELVQAVRNKKLGVVAAVFHKPGRIDLDMGSELSVDNPALVLVSKSGGRQRVFVSDPLQQEKKIGLRMGSLSVSVPMGEGEQAGRTVEAGATAVDTLAFVKRPVATNAAVARVVRKVERLDRPGDEKSREFVLITRPDGKVDAYKTVLAEIEGGIANVELVEGRRMAWQATRVAARAPWYESADFAAGHATATNVLAQYDTLLARYPEVRPVLQSDYALVKGLVDELKARQAEREKARQAALALRYDPTQPYTLEQLERVVGQLSTAAADYPADRLVLDRALAGFQAHLAHLQAGDKLVDGTWRPAADVEREAKLAAAAAGLSVKLEAGVVSGGDLWKALMVPLAGAGLAVVLGLVLMWRRTFVTVFMGLCLLGLPLGYGWYAMGAAKQVVNPAVGTPEGAARVAHASAVAAVFEPTNLPESDRAVTLTDGDVNAFLASHVTWENIPTGADDIVRTGLWLESGEGRVWVGEQLRWKGVTYAVRHEVVLLERTDGVRAIRSSTKSGDLALPDAVGELLWAKLSPQLLRVLAAAPLNKAYRIAPAAGELRLGARLTK